LHIPFKNLKKKKKDQKNSYSSYPFCSKKTFKNRNQKKIVARKHTKNTKNKNKNLVPPTLTLVAQEKTQKTIKNNCSCTFYSCCNKKTPK
jgi:hypothetical protein